MKRLLLVIIIVQVFLPAFGQEPKQEELWKIDSVQIKKNWRTRDKIVMRELLFKP